MWLSAKETRAEFHCVGEGAKMKFECVYCMSSTHRILNIFFTSNVDGKALVQVISVFELNGLSLEIQYYAISWIDLFWISRLYSNLWVCCLWNSLESQCPLLKNNVKTEKKIHELLGWTGEGKRWTAFHLYVFMTQQQHRREAIDNNGTYFLLTRRGWDETGFWPRDEMKSKMKQK